MGAIHSNRQTVNSDPSIMTKLYPQQGQSTSVTYSNLEDIQTLSPKEIEHEFDKIYKHSKHMLSSLTRSPCEPLQRRLAECLTHHSKDMAECFDVMNTYRACVSDEIKHFTISYKTEKI